MKEAVKLSLALGITCGIASSILTFGQNKTLAARQRTEMRQRENALRLVLPDFDNKPVTDKIVVESEGKTFTFYKASQKNRIVALAGEGESRGFGGNLKLLVGLQTDGTIRTVMVTEHKETPGLGTQATDRKEKHSFWDLFRHSEPQNDPKPAPAFAPCQYLDQYAEKRLMAKNAPFHVQQDKGVVAAVSGATVSSRAVAKGISQICLAYKTHRDAIFAEK